MKKTLIIVFCCLFTLGCTNNLDIPKNEESHNNEQIDNDTNVNQNENGTNKNEFNCSYSFVNDNDLIVYNTISNLRMRDSANGNIIKDKNGKSLHCDIDGYKVYRTEIVDGENWYKISDSEDIWIGDGDYLVKEYFDKNRKQTYQSGERIEYRINLNFNEKAKNECIKMSRHNLLDAIDNRELDTLLTFIYEGCVDKDGCIDNKSINVDVNNLSTDMLRTIFMCLPKCDVSEKFNFNKKNENAKVYLEEHINEAVKKYYGCEIDFTCCGLSYDYENKCFYIDEEENTRDSCLYPYIVGVGEDEKGKISINIDFASFVFSDNGKEIVETKIQNETIHIKLKIDYDNYDSKTETYGYCIESIIID